MVIFRAIHILSLPIQDYPPFIPKNFPTGRAIAATGLVYVSLYAIWAKRQEKTDKLEYRQQLQNSLDLLQQAEKKKSKEK